jgi:hypothetical protein
MDKAKLDELLDQIESLDSEDDMRLVFDACRTAQRNLRDAKAQAARQTLKRGDKVKLTGLSPKYLNGLTGTIVARPTGKRIEVKLDSPGMAGRYAPSGDRPMRVPLTCVEVNS